jgi:hypothetical protein
VSIGAFPASKEIENENEDDDEDDWGGAVSKNPILLGDRPLSSDQYRQYQATLCQQSVIGVSKEA